MGYFCVRIDDGGIRRMRKINIWQKRFQAELFSQESIVPAEGKTDSSIWRKRKKDEGISSFSRGKLLEQYRQKVIKDADKKDANNHKPSFDEPKIEPKEIL